MITRDGLLKRLKEHFASTTQSTEVTVAWSDNKLNEAVLRTPYGETVITFDVVGDRIVVDINGRTISVPLWPDKAP